MFLRSFIAVLFVIILSCPVYPQGISSLDKQDSVYVTQKIQVIKSNMEDIDLDEDMFFKIYMQFLSEQKKNIKCSFLTLSNLAKIASGGDNSEVFECLNSMLVYREKDIQIKKKYFNWLTNEINGSVAFHFLQLEGMPGAIMRSGQYETEPVPWDDENTGKLGRLAEVSAMLNFEGGRLSGGGIRSFEGCFTGMSCLNHGQSVQRGIDLSALACCEERLNGDFKHIPSMSGSVRRKHFCREKPGVDSVQI